MQIDGEQINLFSTLMGTEATKYVSKRFALERYLGWSEEDILKNETLWKEENAKKVKDKTGATPAADENIGLGGVGIRPDLGGGEEALPPEGEEGAPPPEEGGELGGAPPAPGGGAPSAPSAPGGPAGGGAV